jgi:hypothetical protein
LGALFSRSFLIAAASHRWTILAETGRSGGDHRLRRVGLEGSR